jgi:hypothetical protein
MRALPFKPGTSPFRINGVFYIGVHRYIEERTPHGFEGLAAALDDAELVAFARQTFLATSFYDLLPIVPITEALARIQKRAFAEFVRRRARAQAQADCDGVYRAFIGRSGSERDLLDGLVKTSGRIYDFGAIEYSHVRPGLADIVRTEVPDPALGWYQVSTAEYFAAVLEHANLSAVHVHCYKKELAHAVQGCKVWRLAFRAEWNPLLDDGPRGPLQNL